MNENNDPSIGSKLSKNIIVVLIGLLASCIAIYSFVSNNYSLQGLIGSPDGTASPAVDYFAGIQNPRKFEFSISTRYAKAGNCMAKEYTSNLNPGTHLIMEYQLKTVSPQNFYSFEISGPDYINPIRLEGENYFLIDRMINSGGKYRIVFTYCAAYSLDGTLKVSEGDWSATNIEVENTLQP